MAPGRSAGRLRGDLGDDGMGELMQGADRTQMARRLVGQQQAVARGEFTSSGGAGEVDALPAGDEPTGGGNVRGGARESVRQVGSVGPRRSYL
ncbi:hypothetical protein [Streptomyces erythrochromogenes]|uniref:hypothetical protein n=1 Tax=Streptomyces erythrochromogenes TaxID=285574 RepID=UPI0038639C17|nr:hypothetical protein OG489_02005 [Streptomyces erythrochromogenes]